MKPSQYDLARRRDSGISQRLFNRILRNFIMITIFSVFVYRGIFNDKVTILNALICYSLTTLVFYFALFVGQIPFVIFNESSDFDQNPRAPSFYSNRCVLMKLLIGIIVLLISFVSFYLISLKLSI